MPPADLSQYLEDCRMQVLDEIRQLVPRARRHGGQLYELMLDYPMRGGKALRPALCIAACRALGGHAESVLRTAAALELYHNAFLIHDDVEDGSEKRRNEDTLHRLHGVPIAVNVGDGMLALTMRPLLDNVELIGLGRTLRTLDIVARMARETAEGQMIELDWVRRGDYCPSDRDYVRMVYKKTCWYTFLAPLLVGGIAAGASDRDAERFARFAIPLGVAFQIQDDVLNLVAAEDRYGKEIGGDLWEGKHTLLLVHALRSAAPSQRERALQILKKPRLGARASDTSLSVLLGQLESAGELTASGHARLATALGPVPDAKNAEDVAFLRELIERSGGVAYAAGHARRRAALAARAFADNARTLAPSAHRDFLAGVVDFVVSRDH
jgi:geranylgeranyl diphosphate synthase, type II